MRSTLLKSWWLIAIVYLMIAAAHAADQLDVITQERLKAARFEYGQRLGKRCMRSISYALFKAAFKARNQDMPFNFEDYLNRQKLEVLFAELDRKAGPRSSKLVKAGCDCEVDMFNATITDEEFISSMDDKDAVEAISYRIRTDQSFVDKKLACLDVKADKIDAMEGK